ncbi:ribosome biogenesis GTPase YqeH [Chengkuizengella axinellae]|uniref:Ribosome biogenesis GTPase YqeH n=1 Tax=Chengkuizengella axinellae TaxID=3064388 RepID=A0ABT9IW34_9BACL|nr:ribosome biogenesis GTPase YqeH [Chengkuizengella sp. 2205SS18-9]MDP5273029.1 ribosome biogenesis GTPase YqeH [Chengkuizengella sp. 2205SS18-9]
MENTNVNKELLDYCSGCGIKLQTTDSNKLGYIPKENASICQRCYKIKHYNEISSITLEEDDFLKILSHVGQTKSLVLNIVDIFDFEGSLITGLRRFVGSNPTIMVVNKVDLLPKNLNLNRILNWVKKQAKEYGVNVVDVVMCSAKKNIGFSRVIEALDKHRKGRDIYVVGATNVGKSTLINRLINDFSDLDEELTTSRYPGTTLDLVKIPLEDGKYIVDTPGIVYTSRMTEIISKRDLQKITPEQSLKPRVYQLNERQTLFFGALARFDFVQGERQSFTCFISNSVYVHRTKLEKADELYENQKGEMLSPPGVEEIQSLPPLTKHAFRIPKSKKLDILISGLGWIKCSNEIGAEVVIHVPKGVKVVLRESMI